MANPSYYFTLFKKFQTLGHVPEGQFHGSANPANAPQGVSMLNATTLYTLARTATGVDNMPHTVPLIGTNPGDTPLWMVLNAKAMGSAAFVYPSPGGLNWMPMPFGNAAATAWGDIGGTPLVNAFSDWLMNGHQNDVPTGISIPNGGVVPGPLDSGPSVFVCSSSADDGTRPNATIPPDFWDSSLIYLVDPNTGAIANPTTLHAASTYNVVAVIGNRGDAAGGKYSGGPSAVATPGVQATAWALTFGTAGSSPAVQLPSLSDLTSNPLNGIYEQYFLKSASYDLVGFSMPVRAVFDGLAAAIQQAVTDMKFTLPMGVSIQDYLETPPSHVCVKVAVRRDDQAWPDNDASPLVDQHIAQRNLVVFDTDLGAPMPNPNINWKYFTVGGPLSLMLRGMREADPQLGENTLVLTNEFPEGAARVLIAVPNEIFRRYFNREVMTGYKLVEKDCREKYGVPFGDHVVLVEKPGKKNQIRLPFLDDHCFVMAIGVEMDRERLSPGKSHRVHFEQQTLLPKFTKGQRCFDVENVTVGGFTLRFDVTRQITKWQTNKPAKKAPKKAAKKSAKGRR